MTPPVDASSGPVVDLKPTDMPCLAITTPTIVASAPIVAEEPQLHHTLTSLFAGAEDSRRPAEAWLSMITDALALKLRPVAIWKIHTASGLFWASRYRVPVMSMVAFDLYTPGVRVSPPRSPAMPAVIERLDASLIAAVRLPCAA